VGPEKKGVRQALDELEPALDEEERGFEDGQRERGGEMRERGRRPQLAKQGSCLA